MTTVTRKHPIQFALSVCWLWTKEHFCNPIGHPRSQHYEWHVRWQMDLLKRRLRRKWERLNLRSAFKAMRPLWVLLAGGAACTIALWVIADGHWFALPTEQNFKTLRESSGSWTLLTAFISAPIAFVIWWFRDTNALWQIDNQRKDTNLKDFQKLSEWASGLHLIEFQKTETHERSECKEGRNHKTIETIQSTQPMAANHHTALQPPSRAEGAASLQIAAVYQLQAFLRGDYGKNFQRPAFALLKTVWLSLVQAHVAKWDVALTDILAEGSQATADEKRLYEEWKNNLRRVLDSPLAVAINDALTREYGLALQHHAADLPNGVFAGMNARELELDGIDLHRIQWQAAGLRKAQLQGVNLSYANLQGADLSWAQLQGVNLSYANLQGANLHGAQLQGANLRGARLQGVDLHSAQLQDADLQEADVRSANLINAQLHNTQLVMATFWDAQCVGAQFQGAMDPNVVGWDRSNLQDAKFSAGPQLAGMVLTDAQRASIVVINQ